MINLKLNLVLVGFSFILSLFLTYYCEINYDVMRKEFLEIPVFLCIMSILVGIMQMMILKLNEKGKINEINNN